MKWGVILSAAAIMAAAALAPAAITGCSDGAGEAMTSDSGGSSASKGGSMARFTITPDGKWMYTVDETYLNIVSLEKPAKPFHADKIRIGNRNSVIETIFPMDTLLFIGSRNGMYIYDISAPDMPQELSETLHFRSCDPVVAVDTLAFVTLNSALGSWCGGVANELHVYDIRDIYQPQLLRRIALSSPRGLAVDKERKMLFVCDNGVRVYDVSNPKNPDALFTSLSAPHEEVGRIDAYDCIVTGENDPETGRGRLIVIGNTGLYQLGYDKSGFSFISKIDLRAE